MERAMRWLRAENLASHVALAVLLTASLARAQSVIAPPHRSYVTLKPVPFEEARAAMEKDEPRAVHIAVALSQASVTPPEIVELARELKNDPDLIYQYVHDNIEFSPLFGVLKGPLGTLSSRSL